MSTSGNRAAIYTRISEDPKTRAVRGQAVNVATQEKDGRRLAAEHGLEVVEVFTDNDLTAADPNVTRPHFELLLERCLAGEVDVVVVYTQDRFVRLTADLERVIAIFSVSGTTLLPVVGTTDFDSPEGKLYARFNTLLGSYEVEKVRLRVRRKMQDNAERGLPYGGAADARTGFSVTPGCLNGIMSANDPAGSAGGEVRKAAKKRELIRLAEKNFRRTRESERYWPETVIAIDQADDEDALDDALAGARMVDHIFEVGLQRFANLRPSA